MNIPTFANQASNTAPSAKPSKPCQAVRAACQAAGFVKGDKQGKNIWKDCIKPILSGQQVTGVTADADSVKACQAKKAKREGQKVPAKAANPTTTQ